MTLIALMQRGHIPAHLYPLLRPTHIKNSSFVHNSRRPAKGWANPTSRVDEMAIPPECPCSVHQLGSWYASIRITVLVRQSVMMPSVIKYGHTCISNQFVWFASISDKSPDTVHVLRFIVPSCICCHIKLTVSHAIDEGVFAVITCGGIARCAIYFTCRGKDSIG